MQKGAVFPEKEFPIRVTSLSDERQVYISRSRTCDVQYKNKNSKHLKHFVIENCIVIVIREFVWIGSSDLAFVHILLLKFINNS